MTNFTNTRPSFNVEKAVAHFQTQGYTPVKASQQAWLEYWKARERGCSTVGGFHYLVDCKDCNESKEFGAACTVSDWLYRHRDHNTWFKGTKMKWNGRSWG